MFTATDLVPSCSRGHAEESAIDIRSSSFDDTLDDARIVRRAVYGDDSPGIADEIDNYSTTYCAYVRGVPTGSLRATRAWVGPIDCEEHYPRPLLDRYRHVIGSASRYCVVPGTNPKLRIGRMLLEAGWLEHGYLGCRLDLVDVREEMIGYYRRLGYVLVAGSPFVHPVWSTRSRVMVFPADPGRPGPLSHVLGGVSNPMTEVELSSVVRLELPR